MPGPIFRTNRGGGAVGTSPGINPPTPYTPASIDYRTSYVAENMVAKTKAPTLSNNYQERVRTEELKNEIRSLAPRDPAATRPMPQLLSRGVYNESTGLERSLPTNIADQPTAINVNGLKQKRTYMPTARGAGAPDVSVNTFDARILCGNWSEERCDKAYIPSEHNQAKGKQWQYQTTYGHQTRHATAQIIPRQASNSETMYTSSIHSPFATGVKEESKSSNKDFSRTGGGAQQKSHFYGDHRSITRPPGNYVNYQCGKQHLTAVIGGKVNSLTAYETTSAHAFSPAISKHVPGSAERVDIYKPPFQMREPGRDGKSKMLCGIKKDEFACERDDEDYVKSHILGRPIPGKQHIYTLDEYRRNWTKSAPHIVAADAVIKSEHRDSYKWNDLSGLEGGRFMAGHVGSWH